MNDQHTQPAAPPENSDGAPEKTESVGSGSLEYKSIYDKNDSRGHLTIFETSDQTRAYMRLTPSSPEETYSPEDIIFVLSNLDIETGIKEDNITRALESLQEGVRSGMVLVAEGSAPLNGKDGACELLFKQENPFVSKNDILVRITDPTNGRRGESIYGKLIEPRHGKMPIVRSGDNVIAQNDDHEFYSDIFGKVVFNDNLLSVEKVLHVSVSKNRMGATLSYTGALKLTRELIVEELRFKNVVYGIDNNAVNSIVDTFNREGKPFQDIPIASGTPMQEGRDGQIVYLFGTHDDPCYVEKSDGSIDIRETNVVQSVKEGDEISYVIPHIEPVQGKDVYGRIIPARKVEKVSLRADKNVRVSQDGEHFFAETGGRPSADQDRLGSFVSIENVFAVQGDLDLSIGNIDFEGFVEIGGDVEDGFKIRCTKNITIRGAVGACLLEAGGNIQIDGGCNGKEQAILQCGGSLQAKYINEANVCARRSVTVRNEIVNSQIASQDRVIVHSGGSIRGGKITAKRGIVTYDVGSDMGVKTILIPGQDYELNEQVREIDEKIIANNNESTKISDIIAPLLKNKELLPKLPEEQRDKLKKTLTHLNTLRKEKATLNLSKNLLINESLSQACPEVIVHHHIYHGVLLKIGDTRREISSLLEGPLRLFEENDRVTVEPYSETDLAKRQAELTRRAKEKYGAPEAPLEDLPDSRDSESSQNARAPTDGNTVLEESPQPPVRADKSDTEPSDGPKGT